MMNLQLTSRLFQVVHTWGPPSLVSLALHGVALYLIFMLPALPSPKKVVQVDPISFTQVVPKPDVGRAGGSGGAPAPEPAKTVPKPPPPKPKPKPKPVVKPPPEPDPIPPRLALPKPAPVPAPPHVAPAPGSTAAASLRPGTPAAGSGAGSGSGAGPGLGTGSGTGVGSGRGYGSGAGSGSALQGYLAKVRSMLERHKIYPHQARSRSEQGTAVVRFTISADGSISGVSLSRPSGSATLDQAAQDTVNRVGRFPPIPGEVQKNSLTVQVPLAYKLHGG